MFKDSKVGYKCVYIKRYEYISIETYTKIGLEGNVLKW